MIIKPFKRQEIHTFKKHNLSAVVY